MGKSAQFFEDWEDDYAPLGLALEWIVRRSDEEKRWDNAASELLRAIRSRELTVMGQRHGEHGSEAVPSTDFLYVNVLTPSASDQERFDWEVDRINERLVFGVYRHWKTDDPGARCPGDPIIVGDSIQIGSKVVWHRLAVAVADIKRLWRYETRATAKGITACREWLEQMRRDNPSQPKKKDDLRSDANHLFHVGPRQFENAWQAAAISVPNSGWGRAGARRGPRKNHDGKIITSNKS